MSAARAAAAAASQDGMTFAFSREQLALQLHAVDPWHADVANQALVRGRVVRREEGLRRRVRAGVHADRRDHRLQQPEYRRVVVDQMDDAYGLRGVHARKLTQIRRERKRRRSGR